MARMHSRARGKSGSKRTNKSNQSSWIRYKPKEIELLVVKFAKEGKSTSDIGMILRDTYGVPFIKAITGKSISKILKENNLQGEIPEDLVNLIKKAIQVTKHLDENKQDKTAKRGLQLTESKIRRLVKYYKAKGVLPPEWKYDKETMQLFV